MGPERSCQRGRGSEMIYITLFSKTWKAFPWKASEVAGLKKSFLDCGRIGGNLITIIFGFCFLWEWGRFPSSVLLP